MVSFVDYEKMYPGSLLSDYISYVDECRRNSVLKEEEKELRIKEYYNNLIGKYFMFRHNSTSIKYVHIDKNLLNRNSRFVTYSMFRENTSVNTNCGFNIDKSSREFINHLWFDCPDIPHSSKECSEITKEDFDSIVAIFDNIEIVVKSKLGIK